MARSGRYKVKFRRRREGKTNYYKRRKYILGGKPRLVVRKTCKHIIAQLVVAKPIGDETLVAVDSRHLYRVGWKGDENNTPAAYLVGLILGYRARILGLSEAIVDIGLHRPAKGARVFAVVKGAIDAGLRIPCGDEVIPSDDRIRGVHIAVYARKLKEESPELFERRFSRYLSRGLDPEDLPKHFEEVRSRIVEYFERKMELLKSKIAA